EGGMVWPLIKEVAEEVGLLDDLRTIYKAARDAGVRVVIVPHLRWEPGDYESWCHPNPTQRAIMRRHTFARWLVAGSCDDLPHNPTGTSEFHRFLASLFDLTCVQNRTQGAGSHGSQKSR